MVTQRTQGDFSLALQSKQRLLDIKIYLFGEEHPSTADSYHSLGDTQQTQATFPQLFRLNGVCLISGLIYLEKNSSKSRQAPPVIHPKKTAGSLPFEALVAAALN